MNNKQILLAIIVIVVALFLWFSLGNHLPIESQIAKQTINYSDFNITKTITFSENDRAEEYSFDLKNPIAAYLLLPKELISKASTIKLTGDFNAQIINDDPLIELIPFSYNPGVKKIKIQFADTNKQLTSILFALPFTNFNELTPEQKATLEDGIKELQANSSIENYFITNSQTVMQQFANNQKSAGLQKGTIPIRISFSQTIDPQQILTSLSTILKKKEQPIVTSPLTQTDSAQTLSTIDLVGTTLANAGASLTPKDQTPNTSITGSHLIKINFKADNSLQTVLPKEIVLEYSAKMPLVMWQGIVEKDEESEVDSSTKLILKDAPTGISMDYVRLPERETSSNKPVYLITLSVDTTLLGDTLENSIDIALAHDTIFSQPLQSKITLINNPCAEKPISFQKDLDAETTLTRKEQAYLSLVSCVGIETDKKLAQIIASKNLEPSEANQISDRILTAGINYDPSSEAKLYEESTKRHQGAFLDYKKENELLKEVILEYTSAIADSNVQLNSILSKATEKETKDLITTLKLKLDLLSKETLLWLDPTNVTSLNLVAKARVAYLTNLANKKITNSTPVDATQTSANLSKVENIETNALKETYGDWKTRPILKVKDNIDSLGLELKELEKSFASLITMRISQTAKGVAQGTGCPTHLQIDSMYQTPDPNNSTIPLPDSLARLKEIIHFFATRNISTNNLTYTNSLSGDSQPISYMAKRIVEYESITNCHINLEDIEDPQGGIIDSLSNSLTAKNYIALRDSLRNEIALKTKQKAGLILIAQRVYKTNYGETLGAFKPKNDGNTIYDKLNFPYGNDSFLSLYEVPDDNKLAQWFGVKTTDAKVQNAKDALLAAFSDPLKQEIEIVKDMKFRSFVTNISTAEQLESEKMLIDYAIDNENLLITKELGAAEDQAKYNYILYNLVTTGVGAFTSDPSSDIASRGNTILGMFEIKKKLLQGMTLLDIYSDSSKTVGSPKIAGYIDQAFKNPILGVEIEKNTKMKENYAKNKAKIEATTNPTQKEDLLLSKDAQATLALKLANYYYDNALYDAALQEYYSIESKFPGTAAQKIVTNDKLPYLETQWNLKFLLGKSYWQSFGTAAKDMTSLKSIAVMLAFSAVARFAVAPWLAEAQGASMGRQMIAEMGEGVDGFALSSNAGKVELLVDSPTSSSAEKALLSKTADAETSASTMAMVKSTKIGSAFARARQALTVNMSAAFEKKYADWLKQFYVDGLKKELQISKDMLLRIKNLELLNTPVTMKTAKNTLDTLFAKGTISPTKYNLIKTWIDEQPLTAEFTEAADGTEAAGMPVLSESAGTYNAAQIVPLTSTEMMGAAVNNLTGIRTLTVDDVVLFAKADTTGTGSLFDLSGAQTVTAAQIIQLNNAAQQLDKAATTLTTSTTPNAPLLTIIQNDAAALRTEADALVMGPTTTKELPGIFSTPTAVASVNNASVAANFLGDFDNTVQTNPQKVKVLLIGVHDQSGNAALSNNFENNMASIDTLFRKKGITQITSKWDLTANDFKAALTEFVSSGAPDETLVVYYTTHGYYFTDPVSGQKTYYASAADTIPSTSSNVMSQNVVTGQEVGAALKKANSKVLLIGDSCFSGGLCSTAALEASDTEALLISSASANQTAAVSTYTKTPSIFDLNPASINIGTFTALVADPTKAANTFIGTTYLSETDLAKILAEAGQAITIGQKITFAAKYIPLVNQANKTPQIVPTLQLSAKTPAISATDCANGCTVQAQATQLTDDLTLSPQSIAKQTLSNAIATVFNRIQSISTSFSQVSSPVNGGSSRFTREELSAILPQELKALEGTQKIVFVNITDFATLMNEDPSANCTTMGCYFNPLLKTTHDDLIAINADYPAFYDIKGNFNMAAINATLVHEKAHRGMAHLTVSERKEVFDSFKNAPNWEALTEIVHTLEPKIYNPLSEDNGIDELLAEYLTYQAYPDLDYSPSYKAMMAQVAPIVNPRITQLINKGEQTFLESITQQTIPPSIINSLPTNKLGNTIKSFLLNFTCHSPCAWAPSQGVVVSSPSGGSIAVLDSTTTTDSLQITGDFGKGFIKGAEVVEYSSSDIAKNGITSIIAGTISLPNISPEGITTIENAMKEGKAVAVISNDAKTSAQKITIYKPQTSVATIAESAATKTPNTSSFDSTSGKGYSAPKWIGTGKSINIPGASFVSPFKDNYTVLQLVKKQLQTSEVLRGLAAKLSDPINGASGVAGWNYDMGSGVDSTTESAVLDLFTPEASNGNRPIAGYDGFVDTWSKSCDAIACYSPFKGTKGKIGFRYYANYDEMRNFAAEKGISPSTLGDWAVNQSTTHEVAHAVWATALTTYDKYLLKKYVESLPADDYLTRQLLDYLNTASTYKNNSLEDNLTEVFAFKLQAIDQLSRGEYPRPFALPTSRDLAYFQGIGALRYSTSVSAKYLGGAFNGYVPTAITGAELPPAKTIWGGEQPLLETFLLQKNEFPGNAPFYSKDKMVNYHYTLAPKAGDTITVGKIMLADADTLPKLMQFIKAKRVPSDFVYQDETKSPAPTGLEATWGPNISAVDPNKTIRYENGNNAEKALIATEYQSPYGIRTYYDLELDSTGFPKDLLSKLKNDPNKIGISIKLNVPAERIITVQPTDLEFAYLNSNQITSFGFYNRTGTGAGRDITFIGETPSEYFVEARFFYKGKEYTGDELLQLIQSNELK